MIETLQRVMQRAERLDPEQQEQIAQQFEQALDAFLAGQAPRRVYHGEEEFMRALGMSEERIARLMAEPVEPEPGEEYDHADL